MLFRSAAGHKCINVDVIVYFGLTYITVANSSVVGDADLFKSVKNILGKGGIFFGLCVVHPYLNALHIAVISVSVHTHEKVTLCVVGNIGPVLKLNKGITIPCHHHINAVILKILTKL